ncbi:proton-coupled folate transporter-like [Penaeus chinensis]|uniref:proton-coupled folate transporter-like n=1 Tax=Penaeus chinensis TaxID=139456 RepID=UPI001FB5CA3E|nr:proton-coupled folate transporter-like [Penaeus chinensis]
MALSRRRLWPALVACVASITIEPMLFVRNIALYGMSVIRENLKLDRFCRVTLNRTEDECGRMNDGEHDDLQVEVQKLDNMFNLFESLVGSLVPILLVVFIASWSDRRGRKVPLMISLCGSALYAAVYLLEAVNPSWPPEVLLLASFLQSVGGGWVLFFMAAYSYIADHSSGEARTLRMTVMSAVWQLGGPAGTALAAWLFDVGGYAWVFGLSLALYVLCLLYTLFVVRERARAPVEGGSQAQARGGGPCDARNILDLFRACFRRRPGNGRLHLLLVMTFMLGAFSSGAHNMYLWTRRVLNWGSDQYSLYSTVNQLCQQGVMLLTAPLLRRLRIHDCVVGAGAALLNMAQLTAFGLTTAPGQGWVLYAFVLLPGGLVGVTVRAVLSKLCWRDEGGRKFSMSAVLEIWRYPSLQRYNCL